MSALGHKQTSGHFKRMFALPPKADIAEYPDIISTLKARSLGRWKARDFRLQGIDGKTYSLAEVRGPKGTLVVFICNHCPYVKALKLIAT
jgi:hypothetical protein